MFEEFIRQGEEEEPEPELPVILWDLSEPRTLWRFVDWLAPDDAESGKRALRAFHIFRDHELQRIPDTWSDFFQRVPFNANTRKFENVRHYSVICRFGVDNVIASHSAILRLVDRR